MAYILFYAMILVRGGKKGFHVMKLWPDHKLEICEAIPSQGQNGVCVCFDVCASSRRVQRKRSVVFFFLLSAQLSTEHR